MKALNLSDKHKKNKTIKYKTATNSSKKKRNWKTAERINTEKQKIKRKLTSQQLESAQQSAQKIPECSTGNAGSKHARQAEERKTADQSTSETQL